MQNGTNTRQLTAIADVKWHKHTPTDDHTWCKKAQICQLTTIPDPKWHKHANWRPYLIYLLQNGTDPHQLTTIHDVLDAKWHRSTPIDDHTWCKMAQTQANSRPSVMQNGTQTPQLATTINAKWHKHVMQNGTKTRQLTSIPGAKWHTRANWRTFGWWPSFVNFAFLDISLLGQLRLRGSFLIKSSLVTWQPSSKKLSSLMSTQLNGCPLKNEQTGSVVSESAWLGFASMVFLSLPMSRSIHVTKWWKILVWNTFLCRCVSFCIRYGRQLACVCAILHQLWASVGVYLCHFASMHQLWSSIVPFCIRYGRQLACRCHFASGMAVNWHVCATLHQVHQLWSCMSYFASVMVVSWHVCAILHEVWSSVGMYLWHFASVMVVSGPVFVSFCIRYGCQLACLCHSASGMVVNWRVIVPFCIRYGRQLAWVSVILHQLWSSVSLFLCHFASGMVVSWRVIVPFCIRYGCQLACHCAILHPVWSSVGVFVPFCIRYGRELACLCHFSSGMVVSWRVCAILHEVWTSVGMYLWHFASIMVVSGPVFVSFCIRYGYQLACDCAILYQVWLSVGVSLCHFASGMVVSWRVCAILHQVWSSVGVTILFCIRYGRQLAWLCHFASHMVVSWRVCVPFCIRYGRQLACLCHFAWGMVVSWYVFLTFCISYGRQWACFCVILHQVCVSVGVWLCHFASGMAVSWRVIVPFCIRYGCQLACHCAILHPVWSSVGVFVPFYIRYGRELACLCHFSSGMVVSWRVCAILHEVWSSVGMCFWYFASVMVVSGPVFVSFCIRYGCQLACDCAILHQVWLSVGVSLCHFASGMVVSWRVCAILHQVWSSVGVIVSFCIRYGRQLACLCVILHHIWSSVGVYVRHFASGMVVSVCVSFRTRYGPQLVCLCHFLSRMDVNWRVCAILHQVWLLVGACLCHFTIHLVVSWRVFVPFCIGYGQVWSSVGMFVPFCIRYIRYGRQMACLCHFASGASSMVVSWLCAFLHQVHQVWSSVGFVPFCVFVFALATMTDAKWRKHAHWGPYLIQNGRITPTDDHTWCKMAQTHANSRPFLIENDTNTRQLTTIPDAKWHKHMPTDNHTWCIWCILARTCQLTTIPDIPDAKWHGPTPTDDHTWCKMAQTHANWRPYLIYLMQNDTDPRQLTIIPDAKCHKHTPADDHTWCKMAQTHADWRPYVMQNGTITPTDDKIWCTWCKVAQTHQLRTIPDAKWHKHAN